MYRLLPTEPKHPLASPPLTGPGSRPPGRDESRAWSLPDLVAACDEALQWPRPGSGSTNRRLEHLVRLCRANLVLGRLVEAHADAAAICSEIQGNAAPGDAGASDGHHPKPGERWGVWAAGPASSVVAEHGSTWKLHGTKSWCSGATLLTHAVVDATAADGQRLFAVNLTGDGVDPEPPTWVGPGMREADTRSVTFDGAEAVALGAPGAYLSRPGFWWGAVGVAACWHGGAWAVADALADRAARAGDPHCLAHLGAVYALLRQNAAVLADAAGRIDDRLDGDERVLARAVRSTVAANVEEIVSRVGRALGPGPLAHDRRHSALVADLQVYVRQHHAERDLESLGRDVVTSPEPWSGVGSVTG